MPCYSPRDAWPPAPDSIDRRFVFSPAKSYAGAKARRLPCGSCVGCLLGKSQDWSTRSMHELKMHGGIGSFLTCTLNEDAYSRLVPRGSLSVDLHQRFMKRMRLRFGAFRFLGCGEYGAQRKRAHYHYLLFGLEFADAVPWSRSDSGEVLLRSPSLDEVWGLGHVLIGRITAQSADYVARYTTKKLDGRPSTERLMRVDTATGEVFHVMPERLFASRRPGIGIPWFERFSCDAFPSDFVMVDGDRRPVPRAYARHLSELDALKRTVRAKRAARARAADNTDSRLLVRNEVRTLRAQRLVRSLGDDE